MINYAGWWWLKHLDDFSRHIGNNHPNWRTHMFQRGRSTTNQNTYFPYTKCCGSPWQSLWQPTIRIKKWNKPSLNIVSCSCVHIFHVFPPPFIPNQPNFSSSSPNEETQALHVADIRRKTTSTTQTARGSQCWKGTRTGENALRMRISWGYDGYFMWRYIENYRDI